MGKYVLKSELFSDDGNKKFELQNIRETLKKLEEVGYKVGRRIIKKGWSQILQVQGN